MDDGGNFAQISGGLKVISRDLDGGQGQCPRLLGGARAGVLELDSERSLPWAPPAGGLCKPAKGIGEGSQLAGIG